MPGEWNRLSRHAKKAVVGSQELAASLESSTVEPEHLVMSLLEDPGSAAVLMVLLAGLTPEDLKGVLEERLSTLPTSPAIEKPPFSPAVRDMVPAAARLAATGPVGTEHLLLAVVEGNGPLREALKAADLDVSELRTLVQLLTGHELRENGAPASPASSAGASAPGSKARPAAPAPAPAAVAEPTVSSYSGGRSVVSHTLSALARLVVDLAGKAAAAAQQSGNSALAEQLHAMRREVEAELSSAASPTARKETS